MESRQPNSKAAAHTTTTCKSSSSSSSSLRRETQTFKVRVPFPRLASQSRSWSLGNLWWSNAVTTSPCRRRWSTAQTPCNSNLTPSLLLSAAGAAPWITTTTITSNNHSTTYHLAMAASQAPTLAIAVALLLNNNSLMEVWAHMQIHLCLWTLWWTSWRWIRTLNRGTILQVSAAPLDCPI